MTATKQSHRQCWFFCLQAVKKKMLPFSLPCVLFLFTTFTLLEHVLVITWWSVVTTLIFRLSFPMTICKSFNWLRFVNLGRRDTLSSPWQTPVLCLLWTFVSTPGQNSSHQAPATSLRYKWNCNSGSTTACFTLPICKCMQTLIWIVWLSKKKTARKGGIEVPWKEGQNEIRWHMFWTNPQMHHERTGASTVVWLWSNAPAILEARRFILRLVDLVAGIVVCGVTILLVLLFQWMIKAKHRKINRERKKNEGNYYCYCYCHPKIRIPCSFRHCLLLK